MHKIIVEIVQKDNQDEFDFHIKEDEHTVGRPGEIIIGAAIIKMMEQVFAQAKEAKRTNVKKRL